ncbi:cysteine proteinase [Xylariaceae sp. FL0662B]|nr:cysteine proteinase [Xylariaceae sp. FL0662B]
MVSSGSHSDATRGIPAGNIDAYAIFEALTGQKIDRRSLSSRTLSDEYEDLGNFVHDKPTLGEEPSPDPEPEDVNVGAVNPYALVEAITGQKLNRHSITCARIMSDVLQTDYDELFDMKHNSVLFAGLKLNKDERRAEQLSQEEIRILEEHDLVTPDLSRLQKLNDLEKVGYQDIGDIGIKMARMTNGKLHLVLNGRPLSRTVSNNEVTQSLNKLILPFRENDGEDEEEWTPPNSSWRDLNETYYRSISRRMMLEGTSRYGPQGQHEHKFADPIQGTSSNSWLIASIFSVFWSNPAIINRSTHVSGSTSDREGKKPTLSIKFFDKGGRNNSSTTTVKVDYEVPISNSTDRPLYSRSSDGYEIWPSLYEKAFAKWISGEEDITQTHNGDPIKAMAQMNNKDPHYYFTDKHSGSELVGLVRSCSVNHRTISPMAAWTHATGNMYRGTNLVANHAYSVLGWINEGQEEKQYIITRNPFGVTEPRGLTSYPGILDCVSPEYWRPASLLDGDGVMSVEVSAFKEYFACIGVAK